MQILSIILVFLFLGCSSSDKTGSTEETKRFNQFLDKTFDEYLAFSPQSLSYFGKKKSYDKLDDYTEAFEAKMLQYNKLKLDELKQFRLRDLDAQAQISYALFKQELEDKIEDYQWRDYGYSLTQQYGIHSNLPVFMMTIHQVETEADLRAYLARLEEFRRVFKEVIENIKRSEKQGIMPPKFVFPYVLDASQKVIHGKPFDQSAEESPLLADFKKKLAQLKLEDSKNIYFSKKIEQVLTSSVKPAYQQLISTLKDQQKRATKDDGAWKFPRGAEFYNVRLQRHTTTQLSASQIHDLGVKNVARIHGEMREVLKALKFKGTLQDFFKEIRENKKYYFANTEEGRSTYLETSKKYYAEINKKVPQFFRLRPKAKFEIRAVEKFRENSAGTAFYDGPAEDGSRPGVYYVNLREMGNLPKYEAEVVLYHEGAPGHHFQIALAQELTSLPQYRRYAHFTAFSEGWGLYTERLAKEMGGYKDPLSEFGRLSLELMRATRLVVDTGIHAKKWSREKAIQYLNQNMSSTFDDQKNEIERYIVMPGQATAYMVGMLKIVELREKAQSSLGSQFDVRDFHDTVLGNGAVPLSVLEELVDAYIQSKKS